MKSDTTVYVDTLMDTKDVDVGSKRIQKSLKSMAQTVNQIGKTAQGAMRSTGSTLAKHNQMISEQRQKVDGLKKTLKELTEQKIESDEFKKVSSEIQRFENSMKSAQEYKDLLLSRGFDLDYKGIQNAEKEIARYIETLDELKAKQESMKSSGTAYVSPDTSGIEAQLGAEAQKLAQMEARLGAPFEALRKKTVLYARAVNTAIKAKQGFVSVLSRFRTVMGKASEIIGKAAKTLCGKLSSGLKRAAAAMVGFRKGTEESSFGLGRLIKYVISMAGLTAVFRKIKDAAKEGFSNLAQYSAETNASISSLMSALTQLKNSFATAFAPILNVVAPILTAFISMISKAVTYVGMLIAALTGQNSFVKATAVQEDYAASLGDTADQMEDTADATKKAEKAAEGYLSPIDEINKFTKEQDNQSDSKDNNMPIPGYTAPTPEDMFETVPIESSIKGLADKIRGLIQSEDWEGLGSYMADGINSGLQKVYDAINWDNVGPKIIPFIDAFTRTFNSLVDNLDWELLGRTIGAGINTVVNTLNRLIEGIDWENLGKKFAVGVNGLVDEVDWTNLGRLIGNEFMILPKIALGFVKELDWSGIGTAIGDSLNGVVNTIDLSTIGELLGTTLTGIFRAAISFSSTFDWKALGTNIYQGINTFFSTTDWSVVGQGISDFVKGLLDTLIVAVEGVDWKQIGESIKTLLVNVDWTGIVERIAELFGAACGGLAATIGGLIGDAFTSAKEYFQDKIEECGGNVAAGILKGILDGLASIGQWIYEHVFEPFIDGFKKAFGINSPSTVMAEQGGYVIAGLLQGLKDKIASVLDWVAKIPGWVKDKLGDASKWLLEKGRNALAGLKAGFAEKWSAFTEFLGEKKKAIVDKFKDLKDKMLVKGRNIINGLRSGASEKWSTLSSFLSEKKDAIVSKFSNIRDSMAVVGRNIIDGIIDGITAAWGWLVDKVQAILDLFTFDFDFGGGGGGYSGGGGSIINIMPNTPTFPVPDIPYLAKGAVIPPNAPFMAILGDQKRGTNVETPVSTIEAVVDKAVRRAMESQSGGTIHVHVDLNGREIAETVLTELELKRLRSGRPLLGVM